MPLTLEVLAQMIYAERDARKESLAMVEKHMEWRLVHFTEEFLTRLDGLERRLAAAHDFESHGNAPIASMQATSFAVLEGKLAACEMKLQEVTQRCQHLEAELSKAGHSFQRRAHEAEAALRAAETRIGFLEAEVARSKVVRTQDVIVSGTTQTAVPVTASHGQAVAVDRSVKVEQAPPTTSGQMLLQSPRVPVRSQRAESPIARPVAGTGVPKQPPTHTYPLVGGGFPSRVVPMQQMGWCAPPPSMSTPTTMSPMSSMGSPNSLTSLDRDPRWASPARGRRGRSQMCR